MTFFFLSDKVVTLRPFRDLLPSSLLRKFTKNGKACELSENSDLGLTDEAPAPAPAPTRLLLLLRLHLPVLASPA